MADDLDNVFAPENSLTEDVAAPVEPSPDPTPPAEPIEPAAEPEAEPQPEPASEPKEEQRETRTVPLEGYLTEREKRQAAERERDQLRQQMAQPQQPIPDSYDDPDGYNAWQAQQRQQERFEDRTTISRVMATKEYGADAVQAAIDWATQKAQGNPGFEQATNFELHTQPHPIDWLIQQHKQETDLLEYSKDPVAFARRILEANGQSTAPTAPLPVAVAPKPASPPVRVPRSLASQGTAPSDVRETATGPLVGVDALFS